MAKALENERLSGNNRKADPAGKIKLAAALRTLLIDKDFNSITTAEIAKTAKANEALIYRYFGDKRGLLHYVLNEYMRDMQDRIDVELKNIDDAMALEKLKKMIWISFDLYNSNRVFAKIILIEVRNYPGYFESEAYDIVKNYALKMIKLIEAAKENDEIRSDVPVKYIRNAIIGAIEHLSLPGVIFGRQFSPNILTDNLLKIILRGILKEK